MIEQLINNLSDIRELLNKLTEEQYNKKLKVLSNAFIGQHVRHIIEFYQCLFAMNANQIVDYDERKRDLTVETDASFAARTIEEIIEKLKTVKQDFPVSFVANYSTESDDDQQLINSSFYRELAYNLDHSIHHQALIKVALYDMKLAHLINEEFGYAPSTIRYLKRCAR